MKNILPWFSFFLILGILSACSFQAPTKTEVKELLMGRYCADKYRLVIEDSTYTCRKLNKGILSTTLVPESCKGTYELSFENETWVVHFNKDPRPKGIQNCKRDFVVWNREEGFLIQQGEQTIMWDLFDQEVLTKGPCE